MILMDLNKKGSPSQAYSVPLPKETRRFDAVRSLISDEPHMGAGVAAVLQSV